MSRICCACPRSSASATRRIAASLLTSMRLSRGSIMYSTCVAAEVAAMIPGYQRHDLQFLAAQAENLRVGDQVVAVFVVRPAGDESAHLVQDRRHAQQQAGRGPSPCSF